jgi:Zn/Cd-binding protein ZinT
MNGWKCAINKVTISPDGLSAMTNKNRLHIYAEKGFKIFGYRKNNFHGTVVFYYEVMQTSASEKP